MQRKLAVGSADDPLEHEADRMADAVVHALSAPKDEGVRSSRGDGGGRIRRASVQVGAAGGEVDADTESPVRSATGLRVVATHDSAAAGPPTLRRTSTQADAPGS